MITTNYYQREALYAIAAVAAYEIKANGFVCNHNEVVYVISPKGLYVIPKRPQNCGRFGIILLVHRIFQTNLFNFASYIVGATVKVVYREGYQVTDGLEIVFVKPA